MAEKKRGLGRGLSALLPGGAPPFAPAPPKSATSSTGTNAGTAGTTGSGTTGSGTAGSGTAGIGTSRTTGAGASAQAAVSSFAATAIAAAQPTQLPPSATVRSKTYFAAGIEELYPSPEQPRHKFDETKLAELADSIRVHGIITPLVVRPRPAHRGEPAPGGYYLIAGERRWRAAQKAGLHEVPVVVQDIEEGEAFERALVENLQRADLGPLEEAAAYQRLVDQFALSHDAIATRIGKDRSTVANAIRLLKLPSPVRQMVEDERLSMGHARALLGLEDAPAMERAARQVVEKQLSVRATESLVKKTRSDAAGAQKPPKPPSSKSASVRDLESRLTKALGGPVSITEDEPGKAGRIEIRYLNLDHLDKLLDRLL